jgi:hypothetical protein
MLDFDLNTDTHVLEVRPRARLDSSDFADLGMAVDPEIAAGHDLAGLIIDAPHFPGWDSPGALMAHLRFVREHHRHVKKIAVVTDSHLGQFAEHLASLFVPAEIRQFPGAGIDQAREWIDAERT